MVSVLAKIPGNPSSIHFEGREATTALEQARKQVADCVGAESREVVFTSGATESANLALRALTTKKRAGRVLLSAIEHPAVAVTCDLLKNQGWKVETLPVTSAGVLDLDQTAQALRKDVLVACVMLANNEVGTIQPIREVAEMAHEAGALLLVDAVQAVGKIPVNLQDLGADILLLSGHKFGAPKGVGTLVVRRGTPLEPVLGGGGQEFGIRPGTQNLPGIVAMGTAALVARRESTEGRNRLEGFRDRLERTLLENLEGLRVMGQTAPRLPNTSNLVFDGVEGDALQMNLDIAGIAVSTTSACSAGTGRPSRVLKAMGLDPIAAASSIRVSLGWTNDEEDVDRIIQAIDAKVRELRKMS